MKFKNCIGKGLLVGALALSLAVPAYAAVNEVETNVARDATRYVSYDSVALTNGNTVYTPSGANTSNTAYVTMNKDSSGKNLKDIRVASYSGSDKISSSYNISQGSSVQIEGAHNYPGQYIRAGFTRTGISGTYYLSGKFYYNGL